MGNVSDPNQIVLHFCGSLKLVVSNCVVSGTHFSELDYHPIGLMLAKKHPDGFGLTTLESLLDKFLYVRKLFKTDGLPETPFTRTKKKTNLLIIF